MGDIVSLPPPPLRIHSECSTGEALGSIPCDCGQQLQMAFAAIAREGGVASPFAISTSICRCNVTIWYGLYLLTDMTVLPPG
jgi:hypothetical protein